MITFDQEIFITNGKQTIAQLANIVLIAVVTITKALNDGDWRYGDDVDNGDDDLR